MGSKKDNWEHFFDQYGMDEITLDKYLFLLNKGTGSDLNNKFDFNEIKIEAHQKVINKDYYFPDQKTQTTSSRGKAQEFFRESLVLPNYRFQCSITGIKTKSLLTAAHIMSWADHKDKRLDPQNGICLSKLVDKCFEDYLIFIDDDYKIQLGNEIRRDKKLFAQLKNFEGKKISLPFKEEDYPNKKYLKLHREKKNKKNK